jgi:ABC-type nitrate/sulfonate/bicarbonate transport system substrate-binding protein
MFFYALFTIAVAFPRRHSIPALIGTLRLRLIFFAILVLATSTNSPRAYAQESTRLRIGQATTSVSFLAIWAARALDTFKPVGIDLKWTAIPGGDPTVLAALDAGDIDLAAVGTDTPLAAVAKGQDFGLPGNSVPIWMRIFPVPVSSVR